MLIFAFIEDKSSIIRYLLSWGTNFNDKRRFMFINKTKISNESRGREYALIVVVIVALVISFTYYNFVENGRFVAVTILCFCVTFSRQFLTLDT